MRIMVPLDGSELAERALAPAAVMLHHAQPPRELMLTRTIRDTIMTTDLAQDEAPYALEEAGDACLHYLQTVAKEPFLTDLTISEKIGTGDPARVICAQAQEAQVDFLMLTTHGRSGVVHALLGSVAEAVARHATVPTLIVRPTGETFSDPEHVTCTVALDGSSASEAVITPAAQLVRLFNGTLHLVRVLPDPQTTGQNERAEAYLGALCRHIGQQGVRVTHQLVWGEPVAQIVAVSQQRPTDLVALATHGRTGIDRWLQGSVAFDILRHLAAPTLIVHAPRDA
jgi:nucleotide-binding universal stress UspA family protein